MARVALHLVTWNGARYLPFLFDSIFKQTFTDYVVRIVDNGSSDETVSVLKSELAKLHCPVELYVRENNAGYAGGHNQLFRVAVEPYVVLVNQDMYLMPDCLERLVEAADAYPLSAALTPRLMRWDFERSTHEGLAAGLTSLIDSLGIERLPNRRFIEKDSGARWQDVRGEKVQQVFGVSGALPLYKTHALRDIAAEGDIFDERFDSYKEDIDVAYRLTRHGYHALVVTDAVAYHDRTAAMPVGGLGDWQAWKNKRQHSKRVRFLSYRNHLYVLFRHESCATLGSDVWAVVWYEFKKAIALLFTEPRLVMRAWRDVWRYKKTART